MVIHCLYYISSVYVYHVHVATVRQFLNIPVLKLFWIYYLKMSDLELYLLLELIRVIFRGNVERYKVTGLLLVVSAF